MTDSELIIQTRQGNVNAYGELVKRYEGNVRSCLAVRLENKHEAEDLAQEAFIIAFNKINDFKEESAFGPWIRTIAFNLLRNYWRKHKPILLGDAAELDILIQEKISLDHSVDYEANRLEALKKCMKKMDKSMRKLLKLRYFEEYSINDLSSELDVSNSALTMRLHRVRKQLQQCIKNQLTQVES